MQPPLRRGSFNPFTKRCCPRRDLYRFASIGAGSSRGGKATAPAASNSTGADADSDFVIRFSIEAAKGVCGALSALPKLAQEMLAALPRSPPAPVRTEGLAGLGRSEFGGVSAAVLSMILPSSVSIRSMLFCHWQ